FLELAVLTPQSRELLALRARQAAIAPATVAGILLDPQRDRPWRRAELLRQRRGRAPGACQVDHLSLELRRIPDRFVCHRERLQNEPWGVHETGSSPLPNSPKRLPPLGSGTSGRHIYG